MPGTPLNIVNAQPPGLYFSASGDSGPGLFRLDPGGTLAPVSLPGGSHIGENGGYAVYDGKLYFFADTAAGPAGLFVLGPDGNVAAVDGISAAPDGVNAHF